jgi:hypothetical protein
VDEDVSDVFLREYWRLKPQLNTSVSGNPSMKANQDKKNFQLMGNYRAANGRQGWRPASPDNDSWPI